MSCSWLCFIVNLIFITISIVHSRYLRLAPVNCSELAPIGTSITQLLDTLPPSNWGFTFLTRTSVTSYFLLDDLKGTITVKRPLDREDLCRLGLCSCLNECLIKLEINAQSDIQTHIVNQPIRILDENDNFCYFNNHIFSLNISENVRLNTRLVLPIAHDPDQSPNNIQSYAFLSNNYSEFRLDYQLTPSLIIVQTLDREVRDHYTFDYCAYEDIHRENRSCCTKILLTITDINDNSPKFEHDQQVPLSLSVSESTPLFTELIQMKATDADEGLNAEIRYSFSKWTLNDPTISQTFFLNPINGSISLLKPLDFEQRNNYELQIQAKDRGANSVPAYATVIIQVIDENDCSPEMFTFSPADVQLVNNSIYILENIAVGSPILYISVSDRDSGVNGRVKMELESPMRKDRSLFQLEKLTENTFSLRTNAELDREEQSSFSFTLIASDQGQVKRSTSSLFELHLIDVNDCSPMFDHSNNYSFSIDENHQENLILQTIRISDPDEHEHLTTRLLFENDPSAKHLFNLNEFNQLIVLKSLDYEDKTNYQFTIVAEDAVGHQTSIPVFIQINDLNDNAVKFLTNLTEFQLEENQENRTFVGQIQAEDADQNDLITYAFHPDDFDRIDKFIELTRNGSLLTKMSFDREQIDQLEFRLIANDSVHIDTTFVQIRILDENDHRPILKTSSPFCFLLNTTQNSQNNETIQIDFEAFDPDEDANGRVSFSLKQSSSNNLRLLSNGTLFLPANIRSYQFDLYLEDDGQPNRQSSLYKDFLLLIVSDRNDCERISISSPLHLEQKTLIYFISIILICFVGFILIILGICCCFYIRQKQRRKLCLTHKIVVPNLTPSFSSSLNGEAENDTLLLSSPSPQFTAMTTVSSSTTTTNDSTRLTTFIDRPTNKSSSLSSSSSSTYVKMSHSFDEEML